MFERNGTDETEKRVIGQLRAANEVSGRWVGKISESFENFCGVNVIVWKDSTIKGYVSYRVKWDPGIMYPESSDIPKRMYGMLGVETEDEDRETALLMFIGIYGEYLVSRAREVFY